MMFLLLEPPQTVVQELMFFLSASIAESRCWLLSRQPFDYTFYQVHNKGDLS